MATSIEWTDETWNPTRGCSLVSPGCTNCYAMKFAHRFSGEGQRYEGLTKLREKGGPVWTGDVRFVPEQLGVPLTWKKPRRVFVNSMSDLFHLELKNEQIAAVFGVMAACPQHTFQILTKRPGNMLAWFDWVLARGNLFSEVLAHHPDQRLRGLAEDDRTEHPWPLPNVWLGVSVEDQEHADARIPLLLKVPAAVRFISAEPLIGKVDLRGYLMRDDDGPTLDWVIVGGESGTGARFFDTRWATAIVDHCATAGVPCFVKQLGARAITYTVHDQGRSESWEYLGLADRKGGDPSEWPEELRVRQFPEVRA